MDQQKIGNFLKTLRKEKGITQEQFAETLNVARRTVSRWETGSNMPDYADITVKDGEGNVTGTAPEYTHKFSQAVVQAVLNVKF